MYLGQTTKWFSNSAYSLLTHFYVRVWYERVGRGAAWVWYGSDSLFNHIQCYCPCTCQCKLINIVNNFDYIFKIMGDYLGFLYGIIYLWCYLNIIMINLLFNWSSSPKYICDVTYLLIKKRHIGAWRRSKLRNS